MAVVRRMPKRLPPIEVNSVEAMHREMRLRKKREYAREYRRKNPEYFQEVEQRPERKAQKIAATKARYKLLQTRHWFAWKAGWSGGGFEGVTASQLGALYHRQRGCCALTGRKLVKGQIEIDHIVPRSRGGSEGIENLRFVLKIANISKGGLLDSELYEMCRDIVAMMEGKGNAKPWR